MLFKLTKTLLPPALTDPNQDGKDEFHDAPFVPQGRNDFGASPLLFKGAFGEIGGADILLVALGDVEVVETGFALVHQAAPRFGKVPLRAVHYHLAAPFSLW